MYKKRRRLSQILVADFNFFLKCIRLLSEMQILFSRKAYKIPKKGLEIAELISEPAMLRTDISTLSLAKKIDSSPSSFSNPQI